MAAYAVMEPPGANGTEATDRAVLVSDRFHVLGFLVPPLWLLSHRLWIEAALAFAAGVGLTMVGNVAGLGFAGWALSLLVSLYVGLEGSALRLNALRRRGWREWGVVEAGDSAEAEIRYLAAVDAPVADETMPQTAAAQQRPRPLRSGPALGLFHYPERS